jgi:hypothetical protein
MADDDIEGEGGAASALEADVYHYRATADAAPIDPECREAKRALVCAITGLFCCGFLLGPIALWLGKRARLRIVEEPETSGVELADAAILIGKIAFGIHLALTLVLLSGLLFAIPASGFSPR